MPSNKVRTRFAPSPTGYMHVGNLRTALYTYLMAKHEDGTFILRIEDTDQGRYVEGAVDVIYNTLRETGLLWDEGPDVGGPVGPYVQSERMGMFKQYAEQLVAEGKAYYCFCTEERLEALHAEQRAQPRRREHAGQNQRPERIQRIEGTHHQKGRDPRDLPREKHGGENDRHKYLVSPELQNAHAVGDDLSLIHI